MLKHLDTAFQIKGVNDDGTFAGYGSVFNVQDSYQEIVLPGAFAESLKSRQPAMLWQHRSAEPIGIYTSVKEDSIGLHVEGRLALKTTRGAEAYELLKMGAINGLSIGFVVRDESYDRVTGVNSLKKVDLWEVSPVTFPANDSARITEVKALDTIKTLADCESYLREAGGLSKSQALAIVAKIKAASRSESDEWAEVLAAAQSRGQLFVSQT
jgi:uncharacterized protein